MVKHSYRTQLTDWIVDEHCAYRAFADKDHTQPENRVAFIEKTPRVRIRRWTNDDTDHLNWAQGPKGHAPEYGTHQPSRDWCDAMLTLVYGCAGPTQANRDAIIEECAKKAEQWTASSDKFNSIRRLAAKDSAYYVRQLLSGATAQSVPK